MNNSSSCSSCHFGNSDCPSLSANDTSPLTSGSMKVCTCTRTHNSPDIPPPQDVASTSSDVTSSGGGKQCVDVAIQAVSNTSPYCRTIKPTTTTQNEQIPMDHLSKDVRDSLRLCDILFRDKMLNEFYRQRTFKHAPWKLLVLCNVHRLVGQGFYYSGESISRLLSNGDVCTCGFCLIAHSVSGQKMSVSHLSCAFCRYETIIRHDHLNEPVKATLEIERIERNHNFNAGNKCHFKLGNESIHHRLTEFNLHLTNPSSGFPMTKLLESSEKTTLGASERRGNRQVLCSMCGERIIDSVFLPCGCMFLCGVCLSKYSYKRCIHCRQLINGYTRGILC